MHSYDAQTRSGTLLADDGSALAFGPETVAPVVRLLRRGQRVRLRVVGGQVVALTLSGLSPP